MGNGKMTKRTDGKPVLSPSKIRKYEALTEIMNKMLIQGMSRKEIEEYIIEKYQYSARYAKSLVDEAGRKKEERFKEWVGDIAEHNKTRLQALCEELYEKGRIKEMLQTIDMLNKMVGAYEQKVKIGTEDNTTFKIKID